MRGLRADEADVLRRILSWPPCYEEGFSPGDYWALVDLKEAGRIVPFVCPFRRLSTTCSTSFPSDRQGAACAARIGRRRLT